MSSLSPKTSQGVRAHELRPAQGMPLDAVPDMGLDVQVRQQELRQAQDVQPLLVPEIPPLVSSGGPRSSSEGARSVVPRSKVPRSKVQGPRSVGTRSRESAARCFGARPCRKTKCNTKLMNHTPIRVSCVGSLVRIVDRNKTMPRAARLCPPRDASRWAVCCMIKM